MNLMAAYRALADRVLQRVEIPAIGRILLPPAQNDPGKLDQFGFVLLEDGSAAAFYCSLEDSLARLRDGDPSTMATGLGLENALGWDRALGWLESESLAQRALGLGVFNAISQSLMRRAGFDPCALPKSRDKGAPGLVGMVGFFRPLLGRLLEQGNEVLVVEKNPARVELQPGIRLAADAAELADCDRILCTASTLINDSLQSILGQRRHGTPFTLIGPSGSGLPDILFELGVDEVGGFKVNDVEALQRLVEEGDSWGRAGAKYSIQSRDYPGIDALLERAGEQC